MHFHELVKDIEISDCRCLNNVVLTGISNINVFFGPNNSGKSTALKAIYNTACSDRTIEDILISNFGIAFTIDAKVVETLTENSSTYQSQFRQNTGGALKVMQGFYGGNIDEVFLPYKVKESKLTPAYEALVDNNDYIKTYITHSMNFGNTQLDYKSIANNFFRIVGEDLRKSITELISIYLVEDRNLNNENIETINTLLPRGNNIREFLCHLYNQPKEEKNFEEIRRLFQELTKERVYIRTKLTGSIAGGSEIEVSLDPGFYLKLENIGYGLQNLLILIAGIISVRSGIVFIEEPEIFLHADSQKRLFGLIENEAKDYGTTFFLSTHSNVLLNCNENGSNYHFRLDPDGYTILNKIFTETDLYDSLRNVGYSLSDFYSKNGLIVVEGKTERRAIEEMAPVFGDSFDFSKANIGIEQIEEGGSSKLEYATRKDIIDRILELRIPQLYLLDRDERGIIRGYHPVLVDSEKTHIWSVSEFENLFLNAELLAFYINSYGGDSWKLVTAKEVRGILHEESQKLKNYMLAKYTCLFARRKLLEKNVLLRCRLGAIFDDITRINKGEISSKIVNSISTEFIKKADINRVVGEAFVEGENTVRKYWGSDNNFSPKTACFIDGKELLTQFMNSARRKYSWFDARDLRKEDIPADIIKRCVDGERTDLIPEELLTKVASFLIDNQFIAE
jgi:predicted ATP-dependent endonuclease of OLD family